MPSLNPRGPLGGWFRATPGPSLPAAGRTRQLCELGVALRARSVLAPAIPAPSSPRCVAARPDRFGGSGHPLDTAALCRLVQPMILAAVSSSRDASPEEHHEHDHTRPRPAAGLLRDPPLDPPSGGPGRRRRPAPGRRHRRARRHRHHHHQQSGGINAVGPVNSEYGFPAWYQDKRRQRGSSSASTGRTRCAVSSPRRSPGSTPPARGLPDELPGRGILLLAGLTLTLPNGGKAVLTLGLEAAFTNGVQPTATRSPSPASGSSSQAAGQHRADVPGALRHHPGRHRRQWPGPLHPGHRTRRRATSTTPLKGGVGPS